MLLVVVAGFLNITFGAGDGVVVLHTLKISSVDVSARHFIACDFTFIILSLVSFVFYFFIYNFNIVYSLH